MKQPQREERLPRVERGRARSGRSSRSPRRPSTRPGTSRSGGSPDRAGCPARSRTTRRSSRRRSRGRTGRHERPRRWIPMLIVIGAVPRRPEVVGGLQRDVRARDRAVDVVLIDERQPVARRVVRERERVREPHVALAGQVVVRVRVVREPSGLVDADDRAERRPAVRRPREEQRVVDARVAVLLRRTRRRARPARRRRASRTGSPRRPRPSRPGRRGRSAVCDQTEVEGSAVGIESV